MDYKKSVENLKQKESEIEILKEEIKKSFLSYYKRKYPGKIEKLEEYFKNEIERIVCLEYRDEYGGWCDAVICTIKNNNGESDIKTFTIRENERWESDNFNFEFIEPIGNETIDIIEDIYSEYPYEIIEYV
ncbi:MAG: hypothetical protein ACYDDE_00630 [bacterium]